MASTSSVTPLSRVDRDEVQKAIDALYTKETYFGWVELRCVYQSGKIAQKFFKRGEVHLANAISDYLEKSGASGRANVYIGRALRDEENRGGARDVSFVQSVSLDIDPVRADKGKPATAAECGVAMEAAQYVKGWIAQAYRASYCWVVSSGNGVQLWYPLDTIVDVRGRRRWWESAQRAWEDSCRQALTKSGLSVKMDTQFDLPRVVKLPGTLSVKGVADEAHPYRVASIVRPRVEYRTEEMSSGLPDYKVTVLSSEVLLGFGENDLTETPKQEVVASRTLPERFWKLMDRDERLRSAFFGTRRDLKDSSPSAQDMALAGGLRKHGFSPEDAMAILRESKGGNPEKRDREDYLRLTVQKAYGI